VLNGGRPLHGSSCSLQFKRWTRLANASSASLPNLVDVELHGIPTHAWELATAELLLSDACWIRSLHPDTVARRDLTSFRLTAWCTQPELLSDAIDLHILEPPAAAEEPLPVMRTLVYPIKATATAMALPAADTYAARHRSAMALIGAVDIAGIYFPEDLPHRRRRRRRRGVQPLGSRCTLAWGPLLSLATTCMPLEPGPPP
jgi:hypothetical protein